MSGSSLSPTAVVQDPAQYAASLARQVGCTVPDDIRGHQDQLLDCLRQQSSESLLAADVEGYRFLSVFGPSVDGVVVQGQVRRRAGSHRDRFYDLMFGVSVSDADGMLTDAEATNGVDREHRDKLLRTYVRNTFCYSNIEIFFSIVNAYTNWSSPRRSPAALRDEVTAALSDAVYVAPVTADAELYAPREASRRSGHATFFYVFSYSGSGDTAAGTDQPRPRHGDEIPYVFGTPLLLDQTGVTSYSRDDVALSRAAMTFWTNFAKTGDPNKPVPVPQIQAGAAGRSSPRTATWEPYDRTYQRYMDLGQKLRMRRHYRARQVAFWNELIPQLHETGRRSRRPELQFQDSPGLEPGQLFAGAVRPSCSRSPRVQVVTAPEPTEPPTPATSTPQATSPAPVTTQSLHTISRSCDSRPSAATGGDSAYSTVLSVTVTIGCSLLVLNLLIFAGMYYQRKKFEETRKRFEGSGQPSTVSLDIGQPPAAPCHGTAGAGTATPGRRKSVGSTSDCAACKQSTYGHAECQVPRQTVLTAAPPNGDLNTFEVPKPPPPPRGSTIGLPANEAQPLLLHHTAPGSVSVTRRSQSQNMDELRV